MTNNLEKKNKIKREEQKCHYLQMIYSIKQKIQLNPQINYNYSAQFWAQNQYIKLSTILYWP